MPVPTSIADISTTAASNYPAGGEAIGTSLDDYLRTIQSIIKQQDSKGSDIASSTTITAPNAGSYFVVTGTTTIAAIADNWNGRQIALKFSGILQLTHSSGLILPGAANITTAAGDCLLAVNESTGVWRVVAYQRASGYVTKEAANTFTAQQSFTGTTAAAPAIAGASDPNTGVFFPGADTIALSTGGAEAMRVDTGGNVGIGVTPSGAYKIQINRGSVGDILNATNGVDASFVVHAPSGKIQLDNLNGGELSLQRSGSDIFKLDTGGNSLHVSASGGLGYGAGAGGTVTQATSKSTAVAINKPTGRIATFNDSLAAGGLVAFQFNNNLLSATDSVVLTLQDGNGYKYSVWAYAVTAGNCQIALKNITAGALAEALGLNFAIIKGATS